MKLKSLLFVCCLGLLSSAFAQNRHVHPQAKPADVNAVAGTKNAMMPGYCEIEIDNYRNENLVVTGQFDDGSYLPPFTIYRYDAPHYISLYYYGYCHNGMYLSVQDYAGYYLYSGYTPVESKVTLYPYMKAQAKADVAKK